MMNRKPSDLWPDFPLAVIVGSLAFSSLLDDGAGGEVSLGKVLGAFFGTTLIAATLIACFVLGVSMWHRRARIASQAAGWIGVLLAVNGAALFVNDPSTGSKMALAAYLGFAILLANRSIVLSRGIVIPTWLTEELLAEARRRDRG